MQLREMNPADLQPNPWNTNEVSAENMEKLAASIRRHGWVKPVLARRIDDSVQILGGQHRVEAAIDMGQERVPVLILDEVDDKRAREIGLIDNARYGADDAIGLSELIEELGGSGEIAGFLPFSDEELAMLATDIDTSSIDDLIEGDDEAEKGEKTKAPAKTHDMLRFKVPIEDSDRIRETLEDVMQEMGYEDSDSLVNAGDALVWLMNDWRTDKGEVKT